MIKHICLKIIFLLLLVACGSAKRSKNVEEKAIHQAKNEVIHFQKTSCHGRCPAYTFKLYSDLSCELDNAIFFIVEGKNRGTVSKNDFDLLVKQFEQIDFFSFENAYNDTLLHDIPSIVIGYSKNNQRKLINCVLNTPEELLQLHASIEALIKKIAWKKVLE